MKIFQLHLFIVFLLLSHLTLAQKNAFKKADEYFEKKAYGLAIHHYQEGLSKQPNNSKAKLNLAVCHYNINAHDAALPYLLELHQKDSLPIKYYPYCGDIYRTKGNYAEARNWYLFYAEIEGNTPKIDEKIAACVWAKNQVRKQQRFTLEVTPIHTTGQSFGIQYYGEDVVYSSMAKKDLIGLDQLNPVTGKPYLNLYRSSIDEFGAIGEPELFSKRLTSSFHEGAISFNSELNELYFTRNSSFKQSKKGLSEAGENHLKIYRAVKKGKQWTDIEALTFNSNEYSCAHPALSADGSLLFFSSNMPGGLGGKDLYVCERQDNGWGPPINLGNSVNTDADETFPFIDATGALYFASNGHTGFGGLDVFVSTREELQWSTPNNLGLPINSSMDDFAFVQHPNGKNGFISSNRGSFEDSIYAFVKHPSNIKGIALSDKLDEPIADAQVKLLLNDSVIATTNSDENGLFALRFHPIKSLDNYRVQLASQGFIPLEEVLTDQHLDSTLTYRLEPRTIRGIAQDGLTDKGIENATVKIFHNDQLLYTTTTDALGKFSVHIDQPDDVLDQLSISIDADGYSKYTRPIVDEDFNNDITYSLENEVEENKVITFNNIYFEYNRWDITDEAKVVLDRVKLFLQNHPEISIELSAHTDSRGGNAYNLRLSDKRAKAAVKYLIDVGIERQRLKGKGYGENKLINNCNDTTECEEEAHQKNRRIEVKIVSDDLVKLK